MKTKIKESSRFDSHEYPVSDNRGYYFHADEDFREDWNWEKTKSNKLPKQSTLEKKLIDKLIR